jgi:hypothetical protein
MLTIMDYDHEGDLHPSGCRAAASWLGRWLGRSSSRWCWGLTAVVILGTLGATTAPESQPSASTNILGAELVAVAPPPFSEGMFPCSECHKAADEVNTTPHAVDFHDKVVFEHDAKNRWCLDCHAVKDRDKLHLADGRLIPFEESYRLCGQCHGTHLRDWKAGEHGKRTGSWSGLKRYLLCPSCHDPHSPRIKPIAPKPAPIRPEDIR